MITEPCRQHSCLFVATGRRQREMEPQVAHSSQVLLYVPQNSQGYYQTTTELFQLKNRMKAAIVHFNMPVFFFFLIGRNQRRKKKTWEAVYNWETYLSTYTWQCFGTDASKIPSCQMKYFRGQCFLHAKVQFDCWPIVSVVLIDIIVTVVGAYIPTSETKHSNKSYPCSRNPVHSKCILLNLWQLKPCLRCEMMLASTGKQFLHVWCSFITYHRGLRYKC